MVGRLVQQQQIGVGHQGAGEEGAPLEAAGQAGEVGFGVELETRDHRLHLLFPAPAVAALELVLGPREFAQGRRRGRLGDRQAGGVIVRQQWGDLAQPAGDHVECRALQASGHVLGQARAAQALLPHDAAAVRLEIPRDQLHQRGLAGPVAADQADALARFEAQVGRFQEGVAAEVELDACE